MGRRDLSVLLDTHALLWWFMGDRRLSRAAREAISREEALASVVSLWEVELKRVAGGIEVSVEALAERIARTEGFAHLDVRPGHVVALATLPAPHGDPFDRMLAAQAMHERLPLVTRDRNIRRYPIETIW